MKLSPSNALRIWHAELGFAQLENSTWGRIKKLDRTQPMHGELSDCYSGFMDKSLLLDESHMITERNPLVSWQELSMSWTV